VDMHAVEWQSLQFSVDDFMSMILAIPNRKEVAADAAEGNPPGPKNPPPPPPQAGGGPRRAGGGPPPLAQPPPPPPYKLEEASGREEAANGTAVATSYMEVDAPCMALGTACMEVDPPLHGDGDRWQGT